MTEDPLPSGKSSGRSVNFPIHLQLLPRIHVCAGGFSTPFPKTSSWYAASVKFCVQTLIPSTVRRTEREYNRFHHVPKLRTLVVDLYLHFITTAAPCPTQEQSGRNVKVRNHCNRHLEINRNCGTRTENNLRLYFAEHLQNEGIYHRIRNTKLF